MNNRRIGQPRAWEPHEMLLLCWAGAAAGDVERRQDVEPAPADNYDEPAAFVPRLPVFTSERQQRIVAVLRDHPEYTTEEIAQHADVSISYASHVRARWREWHRLMAYHQEAA